MRKLAPLLCAAALTLSLALPAGALLRLQRGRRERTRRPHDEHQRHDGAGLGA